MSQKLTQTELGEEFGLSSIAMGKKLIELNLRDKETKLATQYAISNNLAKNVTYSKGGKDITMTIWNNKTIQYIKKKTRHNDQFLAEMLIGKLKALKKIEDDDTQGDKVQQWSFDLAYEDFENSFKKVQNNHSLLTLFFSELEKSKLFQYSKNYDLLKDLETIATKTNLDNNLNINDTKEKIIKI